jgi:prepilin-type N-terminal cleavage/methylation domain-containing protein/prepilin-type processing-associated H-X9-DG protein
MNKTPSGFSLVELLVVLAIIALLIALLLPALAGARQSAESATCLANLHELGKAAMEYVSEFNGTFPPAYYGAGTTWRWDFHWVTANGTTTQEPGILWADGWDMAQIQILQCPALPELVNPESPVNGYNYNTSYIGHGAEEINPNPAMFNELTTPSECALFGDGGYGNGGTSINYFMRAPDLLNPVPPKADNVSDAERASGTQAYRHGGATNVVYCDGHGETLTQCYTQTAPTDVVVGTGTGFLSLNNSAYQSY